MLIKRLSHSHPARTRHAGVLALMFTSALALVALAGCGATAMASGAGPSNAAAQLPNVTITAHDYAFDLPSTIPAGLVHLTFVN